MKKKIAVGLLVMIMLGAAVWMFIPRLQAQIYGAKQTEMERLERELNRKLEAISQQLNNMQGDITWIRRKVDDIERKVK